MCIDICVSYTSVHETHKHQSRDRFKRFKSVFNTLVIQELISQIIPGDYPQGILLTSKILKKLLVITKGTLK